MKPSALPIAAALLFGVVIGWEARTAYKPTIVIEYGPQLRHDTGMDYVWKAEPGKCNESVDCMALAECSLTANVARGHLSGEQRKKCSALYAKYPGEPKPRHWDDGEPLAAR